MPVFTSFYAELQKIFLLHSESLNIQTSSSEILGYDREFFIRNALQRCLPSNVTTERGVIVDINENESNPQDIILYRIDCPILSSFIGTPRFLAEGVVACIEVKSNLIKSEFKRALDTLKTACQEKKYLIDVPINIEGEKRDMYRQTVRNFSYTNNIVSTRKYIFAYKGVTLQTLLKYMKDNFTSNNISFWDLPSAICILNRGICLVRDDGQVLPAMPPTDLSQCLYHYFEDQSRCFELFMMHILTSCITAGAGIKINGTPLHFNIYDYMLQRVSARQLYVRWPINLTPLKIIRDENNRAITTNEYLSRQGFE